MELDKFVAGLKLANEMTWITSEECKIALNHVLKEEFGVKLEERK